MPESTVYSLETLGNSSQKEYVFLVDYPEGVGMYTYGPSQGIAILEHYPDETLIRMSPRFPGVQLPSLIGNTLSYLIVNRAVCDLIAQHCPQTLEILPLIIINHKGREHSRDYVIINPIGTYACLDRKASEIVFLDDDPNDEIVAVEKIVLSTSATNQAPPLFRIPEVPDNLFVKKQLLDAFHQHAFTNIVALPVEMTA